MFSLSKVTQHNFVKCKKKYIEGIKSQQKKKIYNFFLIFIFFNRVFIYWFLTVIDGKVNIFFQKFILKIF